MVLHGNTPYVVRGYQEDYKEILFSPKEIALMFDGHVVAGYGILKAGTVMGQISESTNRLNQFVPYVTEDPQVGETWAGMALLLIDGAASAVAHVTLDDSYKFAVGDHGGAVDSDGSPVDLGAVVSIDRTTYANKAVITFTNNVTTGITVAKAGGVFIQTVTTSPYTKAQFILLNTVDTGTGANAKGADAPMLWGNALLNTFKLTGYDAHSKTDLGSADNGLLTKF